MRHIFSLFAITMWMAACSQSESPEETSQDSLESTSAKVEPAPEKMLLGQTHYTDYCAVCHMPDGSGIEGVAPPMTGSPVIEGDNLVHFLLTLERKAPAAVPYPPTMGEVTYFPPQDLAALVTYLSITFADNGRDYSVEEVDAQMAKDGF